MDNVLLGQPVSFMVQIKTPSNELHFTDISIFSFEKDKYYLTITPRKFEVSGLKQDIHGRDPINIQNLLVRRVFNVQMLRH